MTPETAIELLDRMHASPDRLNDADKNIVANLRSTHRTSEVSIADDIESGSVWFIHTFFCIARNAGGRHGCGYDFRGLDDAIVFPSGLEDPPSSGPEHCPECGRRWPLLA